MKHNLKLIGIGKIFEKDVATSGQTRKLTISAKTSGPKNGTTPDSRAHIAASAWGKYLCERIDAMSIGDDVFIVATPRFDKDSGGLNFSLHSIDIIRPQATEQAAELEHVMRLTGLARITDRKDIRSQHRGLLVSMLALTEAEKDGRVFSLKTYINAKAWGDYACQRIEALANGADVFVVAVPRTEEYKDKTGAEKKALVFNLVVIEAAAARATTASSHPDDMQPMDDIPF